MRFLVLALTATLLQAAPGGEWDRFRGPNGSGVSADTGIPAQFGPDKNVVWKTALPEGNSSPVFGRNAIFLTGFEGQKLYTLALDRKSGRVLWPRGRAHSRGHLREPNNPASPSAATDGVNVFTFFQDFGLLAYGPDGNELWRRELGPFNNPMGLGASPLYVNGKVIQVCDSETESFILAVDAKSGKTVWRKERPFSLRGFSTPILWQPPEGGLQLLLAGSYELKAYDVESGDIVWYVRSLTWQLKPTPVMDEDTIYVLGWAGAADLGQQEDVPPFEEILAQVDADGDNKLSPAEAGKVIRDAEKTFDSLDLDLSGWMEERDWEHHRRKKSVVNAVQAIKLGGQGDMTESAIRWRYYKTLPNVPSPLLFGDVLYLVKDGGIVTALDKKTGEVTKQGRLRDAMDRYFASPVAADGKVFMASETGVVSVLNPGPQWDVVQVNDMGEEIWATPVITDGRLYLRTKSALYCFDE
ncbi:MAG: PQQ-binding-like beta-propeller repeat protein [Bryobacterales bacterium]